MSLRFQIFFFKFRANKKSRLCRCALLIASDDKKTAWEQKMYPVNSDFVIIMHT